MTTRAIQKAVRAGSKARLALSGATGSGKTWTSLEIASVLADGKGVLLIDTELGSASLYGDEWDFQTVRWDPPYNPTELAAFIKEHAEGFGCIVIDSLSHFWTGEGGTLDIVERTKKQSPRNEYAGWAAGTPIQNTMVQALLSAPTHIIVTMRAKMRYDSKKDKDGKNKVDREALEPVQRAGIEYEFTLLGDLSSEHRLSITKSRCKALADRQFPPHGAKQMAKTLLDWLNSAAPDASPPPPSPEPQERKPDPLDLVASTMAPASAASQPDLPVAVPVPASSNGGDETSLATDAQLRAIRALEASAGVQPVELDTFTDAMAKARIKQLNEALATKRRA